MRIALFVLAGLLSACASSPATTAATASPTPSAIPSATPTSAATVAPTPTATSPPTAPPSPMPTATATPPPLAAGYVGLNSCPAYAPGQHPLGNPALPGAGVHADASLDWSGCGSVTLPPGTTRFITGNNWQLGFAATCPNELNYGPGGMGTNVKIAEQLIDGSAGPDSAEGAGPWTDQDGSLMPNGGNFQLKVTSLDLRCRWHIQVYPAN